MTSDTKKGPDRPDESRRTFLRAGLVGATATAVGAGAVATPAQATENDADKKKARYQESAHVKKYYQTNRY
ncbi:MAG: formate dehydrogenase [Methylobacterium sp.]|nr:MAG: formate dehydrogenase [Methylobacterium sp.]